jgi:hypothetical protein
VKSWVSFISRIKNKAVLPRFCPADGSYRHCSGRV